MKANSQAVDNFWRLNYRITKLMSKNLTGLLIVVRLY
jgi:hypothetical protein